jgi:hypothetical protein
MGLHWRGSSALGAAIISLTHQEVMKENRKDRAAMKMGRLIMGAVCPDAGVYDDFSEPSRRGADEH